MVERFPLKELVASPTLAWLTRHLVLFLPEGLIAEWTYRLVAQDDSLLSCSPIVRIYLGSQPYSLTDRMFLCEGNDDSSILSMVTLL